MIQFITNLVMGIALFWLTSVLANTFAERKPKSIWVQLLICGLFATSITLINQLNILYLNMSAVIIFHTIYIFLFFKIKWYYALLLALLQWGITAFAETSLILLLAAMLNEPLQFDYANQDIFIFVGQVFGTLFSLAMILIIRYMMQKRKKQLNLPQNLAVIIFPVASVFVCIYVIVSTVDLLPHQQVAYIGVAVCIIMVLVNMAALIGNEHVRARYILQNEIDAMKHQEELTVGLMRQQEEHLKETKAQAHDFKNHLLCLRSLIDDRQSDQGSSLHYIDELLQSVEGKEIYTEVKNEALRSILARAKATCDKENIDFKCRIDYSDFSFMSYSDISILFSNVIDNATFACKQQDLKENSYIDIKILRQDEMLFLQFVNSKSGDVKFENGVLLSTKPCPKDHGIGFKNIERVVQKHGGEITIDYDDMEFRLYVNFPLEKKDE